MVCKLLPFRNVSRVDVKRLSLIKNYPFLYSDYLALSGAKIWFLIIRFGPSHNHGIITMGTQTSNPNAMKVMAAYLVIALGHRGGPRRHRR
jgi:hypothetical protein